MSSPRKRMRPPVTMYSGLANSVLARVDLPEPLGPISAWTSPSPTVRSMPDRMGMPSSAVATCKFSTSKSGASGWLTRPVYAGAGAFPITGQPS